MCYMETCSYIVEDRPHGKLFINGKGNPFPHELIFA